MSDPPHVPLRLLINAIHGLPNISAVAPLSILGLTLAPVVVDPEIETPQSGSRNDTAICPFPMIIPEIRVITVATIFMSKPALKDWEARVPDFIIWQARR